MSVTNRLARARFALAAVGAASLVAAGCADEPAGSTAVAGPLETVVLGVVPDAPTPLEPPPPPATPPPTTLVVEPEIEPIDGPIGEVVEGNRVLLIGDSAMATLTRRQDGIACPVLPDIGWQVRVEAEIGRFVSFATEVIELAVVDSGEDWDVVGLMFGLHVDTPPEEFGQVMSAVIERLDGRPVIVYTVAERTGPDAASDEIAVALNEQIRSLRDEHPNVVILDWAEQVNTEDTVDLVDADRVPTTAGMERLVILTAYALGTFPPAPPVPSDTTASDATSTSTADFPPEGACLESFFTDDSAILL